MDNVAKIRTKDIIAGTIGLLTAAVITLGCLIVATATVTATVITVARLIG